jgi:hypothetical protein
MCLASAFPTPGLIVDGRLARFLDECATGTNREGQLGQFTGHTVLALEEMVRRVVDSTPIASVKMTTVKRDVCGYCHVAIYFVQPPAGFVCSLDHPYREEFDADGGWWLHEGREENLRYCNLFGPDAFKATPAPKAVQ